MQNISKRLILSIVFILAVVIGGWFWYASKAPVQQQIMPTVVENQEQRVTENQPQETDADIVVRNLDVSKWKTYRNEEYGIEFKYPEEMFDVRIDGANGAGVISGPDELRIWLTQKGYSIDDDAHQFILTLSFLKSLTEYYVEKDGTCKFIDIAGKKGKICEHNDYKEFQGTFNRYLSFVDSGDCSGKFIVRFDEKKLEAGDFESAISIDCSNDFGVNSVYQLMYQSIHFFPPTTPGE
ncbi:MAG: hypothetical protein PHT88_01880 [Candidatus Moranbacteria bacterium]|nr:hypothetical protein [Candidatus Moranbacteria bacterium]